MTRWFRWLAAVLIALAAVGAGAAGPPATPAPIIRVETGDHQGFINRVLPLDPGRLLTISDDQTARVWKPDGAAVSVIRGRTGLRDEGALYAAAASRRYVALAGRAGVDTGAAFVRLLDLNSLKPAGLLSGLPDVVTAMAFSADGQILAIGFDRLGVRLYALGQGDPIAQSSGPGGSVSDLVFLGDGRLVVVGDSDVAILTADHARLRPLGLPPSLRPWRAAASPDGRTLAVGSRSGATIALVDLASLRSDLIRLTESPGAATSVAWSRDGKTLLAGGYDGGGGLIWRMAGDGTGVEQAPSGGAAVTALVDNATGAVFADADGGWGVWRRGGQPAYRSRPVKLTFRASGASAISLSPDGARVRLQGEGRAAMTLDVAGRRLLPPGDDAGLVPPRPSPVATARDLERNEKVLSSAAIGGDRGGVLGTNYYVRRVDGAGRTLWKTPAAAAVWGLAVADNARFAVAAQGDGTLAWLDLASGDLELKGYVSPLGDWVVWTPDGFFDRSGEGGRYVGHSIDLTPREGSTFVSLERTARSYFRSDLIQAALRRDKGDSAALVQARTAIGSAGARLAVATPPEVRIISVCGLTPEAERTTACFTESALKGGVAWSRLVTTRQIDVTISLDASKAESGATQLRVAGIQRLPIEERKIRGGDTEQRRFRIDLPPGDPLIEISVANKDGSARSEVAAIKVSGVPNPSIQKPSLYILAIGVADYQLAAFDLNEGVASNDARSIASALSAKQNGAFASRTSRVLVDGEATGPAIRSALKDLIGRVQAQDLVIVFFSGHGQQVDGDYVFAPYEAGFANREALMERGRRGEAFPDQLVNEIFREDGISQGELTTALAQLRASRTVVVLDTCFGGAFDALSSPQRASMNTALGERFAESSGRYLIASSRGFALDDPENRAGAASNSIFTSSLLRALGGEGDRDRDGIVTLNELGDYVRSDLPRRTAAFGAEQRPVIGFYGDPYFPLMQLSPGATK